MFSAEMASWLFTFLLSCAALAYAEERAKFGWPVHWNVPSYLCNKYGLNFTRTVREWGMVQNHGGWFRGERDALLYDPGEFPALLATTRGSAPVPRNGGVPQQGDLDTHLKHLATHIKKLIPDTDFKGLGIIDFEEWRPTFRQNWASLNIYRDYSRDLEKKKHPFYSKQKIEQEAKLRWEIHSKKFILQSLKLAQKMRPKAKWGYYGFPFCFNYTPTNKKPTCTKEVIQDNDNMKWLWDENTALYPSLYLIEKLIEPQNREGFMEYRVAEARRIAKSRSTPIYPYIRFVYPDTDNYLTEKDMYDSVAIPKKGGSTGLLIWGSSLDVNTKEKCEVLHEYLEKVLGPALVKASGIEAIGRQTQSSLLGS